MEINVNISHRHAALQAALWVWKDQCGSASTKLAGLLDTADRIEQYLLKGADAKGN